MLPTDMTVTPAYGRDYRSKDALMADWNEGKDFRLHLPTGTRYFSKRDVSRLRGDGVRCLNFRYNQMRIVHRVIIRND